MPSITEIFEAIWKLALPVAAVSFVMVWWALKKGLLQETEQVKALTNEIKAMSRLKRGEKPDMNPLHSKWMKFGGGFYGIVAIYTYGLVEWDELRTFVADFGGFGAFIRNLNIGVLVNIFIEGFKNFITAISWPVYWMAEFGAERIWIWGGMAYAGYWLGMKIAQQLVARNSTPG
jgi:hypothetical protein